MSTSLGGSVLNEGIINKLVRNLYELSKKDSYTMISYFIKKFNSFLSEDEIKSYWNKKISVEKEILFNKYYNYFRIILEEMEKNTTINRYGYLITPYNKFFTAISEIAGNKRNDESKHLDQSDGRTLKNPDIIGYPGEIKLSLDYFGFANFKMPENSLFSYPDIDGVWEAKTVVDNNNNLIVKVKNRKGEDYVKDYVKYCLIYLDIYNSLLINKGWKLGKDVKKYPIHSFGESNVLKYKVPIKDLNPFPYRNSFDF